MHAPTGVERLNNFEKNIYQLPLALELSSCKFGRRKKLILQPSSHQIKEILFTLSSISDYKKKRRKKGKRKHRLRIRLKLDFFFSIYLSMCCLSLFRCEQRKSTEQERSQLLFFFFISNIQILFYSR